MSKRKAKKTTYAFKSNRYLPSEARKVGPQVIGEAIEAAASEAGVVDKKQLIENARPDEAPLHPCFEWNDPRAADLYRDYQARNLVNAVVVTIKGHSVPAFPTVVVANVTEEESESKRENVRIVDVLNDPDKRSSLINEVLTKLMSLRRQYRSLNELEIVWRAVDEAVGA